MIQETAVAISTKAYGANIWNVKLTLGTLILTFGMPCETYFQLIPHNV